MRRLVAGTSAGLVILVRNELLRPGKHVALLIEHHRRKPQRERLGRDSLPRPLPAQGQNIPPDPGRSFPSPGHTHLHGELDRLDPEPDPLALTIPPRRYQGGAKRLDRLGQPHPARVIVIICHPPSPARPCHDMRLSWHDSNVAAIFAADIFGIPLQQFRTRLATLGITKSVLTTPGMQSTVNIDFCTGASDRLCK